MDTANISFDINTTDGASKLGVEVWIDNVCMYQTDHVTEQHHFSHDISDADGEHELKVVLKGKTNNHTKVDEQGNIVKDATLTISNVVIEDLDVNQLFFEKCIYTHNFNGTQPEIEDTFHGVVGCNGTISFKFSTPIYLWLLENM